MAIPPARPPHSPTPARPWRPSSRIAFTPAVLREMMDASEVEENVFAASDAKLHGGMCGKLSEIICKVLEIFPVLEAARPRSKSGIQALCSLHVAIDKAKNLLHHCSNSSRLYLAITGDSVVVKFEKARCALQQSLKNVIDIVPQAIGSQIMDIVSELDRTVFMLDQSEKQAGDEVIQLLQKEKKFIGSSNDAEELEIFHHIVTRLGIISSRAALTERRTLKKLLEKARAEEDKHKESIVAFLLHLMRKYSKVFRIEVLEDTDSQGSAPCSPTVMGASEESLGAGRKPSPFEKQLHKVGSFCLKPNGMISGNMPTPPEEFRCPISLQLMYDPVIISSGQTYERVCIEKWFNDGHHTCPKTQQQLSHLCLTPNYCVKGLISSWCEQNRFPFPEGPPGSLDLNYWRLALSESEATNSSSMTVTDPCDLKGVKVVPLDCDVMEEYKGNVMDNLSDSFSQDCEIDIFDRYNNLLSMLSEGKSLSEQQVAAEQIRFLLKDDNEARIYMGANGFAEALIKFLRLAVEEGDVKAQEVGAMALFNLAVNNNKNKGIMLSAGVIPLLEEMISTDSYEAATALYLNLTCLDDAKSVVGSSKAVPFLIQFLMSNDDKMQCRADALHTLYNLSSHQPNIPSLLSAGIVQGLRPLIITPAEGSWSEKSIALLINIVSNKQGKEEIMSTPGLVGAIAAALDNGEPPEQEQAVSCLLILCEDDPKCIHAVLQEGIIPALVSASVNGTSRGKEKAQKLLMLFREQRQRDPSPSRARVQHRQPENDGGNVTAAAPDSRPLFKSASKRLLGRTITAICKAKHMHFSMHNR